eukprot:7821489-Lingulodinium_polyedra.AAC.1
MGEDVLLPRSAAEPFRAILFLRVTKRGFDQRVVLRHPEVVRMLLAFAERYPARAECPFAPSSYGRMRRWLPRAMQLVGLGAL